MPTPLVFHLLGVPHTTVRVGCCSPLVTPDLIRGRLIEPLVRLATAWRCDAP